MKTTKNELSQASKGWKAFHEDEEGMETLQVVMLVGIAAVVLIVVKIFWTQIRDWVLDLWNDLRNTDKEKKFQKS